MKTVSHWIWVALKWCFYIAVILGILIFLSKYPSYIMVVGILVGIFIAFPIAAKWGLVALTPLLTNDPNLKNLGFGLEFTEIHPEEAKIIKRGGKVITILHNANGKEFAGRIKIGGVPLLEVSPERYDLWDLVEISSLDQSQVIEIEPQISDTAWLPGWQRFVVGKVNKYFSGIQPFQGVVIHKLTRFKKFLVEGETILREYSDHTDHIRLSPFIWYVRIPGVDLKGKYKATVLVALDLRSINPYKTAIVTTAWDELINNHVKGRVQTYARQLDADTLIAGSLEKDEANSTLTANAEEVHQLATAIMMLNNKLTNEDEGLMSKYGLEIVDVSVEDIQLDLTEEEERAWSAVWRAKQEGQARKLLEIGEGEGKAEGLIAQIKAMETNPEIARDLKKWESIENAGESGANLFVSADQPSSGGSQNQNRELLAVLQKLTKTLEKGGDSNE